MACLLRILAIRSKAESNSGKLVPLSSAPSTIFHPWQLVRATSSATSAQKYSSITVAQLYAIAAINNKPWQPPSAPSKSWDR